MSMDAYVWILLPALVAAGSSLLAYYIMQARLDVAVSRERESTAEARAEARTWRSTIDEKVKAAQEEMRRKALDDFMQEFRVEERHYFRDTAEAGNNRLMILQERLFFRNLPLSNWVEHEMLVENRELDNVAQISKGFSIFSTKSMTDEALTPHLIDVDRSIPIAARAEILDRAC